MYITCITQLMHIYYLVTHTNCSCRKEGILSSHNTSRFYDRNAQIKRFSTELQEIRGGNQGTIPCIAHNYAICLFLSVCQFIFQQNKMVVVVEISIDRDGDIHKAWQKRKRYCPVICVIRFLFVSGRESSLSVLICSVEHILIHVCYHLNVFPTGPLLHETLDVEDIPLWQIRDLSVYLCGKDVSFVSDNGNVM